MGSIRVVMDPSQRRAYINTLKALDGMQDVEEDPLGVYCPISLTCTPEEIKQVLKNRQETLKKALSAAGLHCYDPSDSFRYNPDYNKDAEPWEVYGFDSEMVVRSRFFSGHNIMPSTGQGNEFEKARVYNKIPVILMDRRVRTSRMLPFRTIYVGYDDFDRDADVLPDVFRMLAEFEPGIGFNGSRPALLGFHRDTGRVVDLEDEVYRQFPQLRFCYNPNADILKLAVLNPEILCEKPVLELGRKKEE